MKKETGSGFSGNWAKWMFLLWMLACAHPVFSHGSSSATASLAQKTNKPWTFTKRQLDIINSEYKKRMLKCKMDCVASVEERKNRCIYECISASCFHNFFVLYKLEEGEVDEREEMFKECTQKEIESQMTEEKNKRIEMLRKKSNGNSLSSPSFTVLSLCLLLQIGLIFF